jgi:hypothetical protein
MPFPVPESHMETDTLIRRTFLGRSFSFLLLLFMETSGMTAVAEKYGARILPFEKTSIRRIES